MRALLALLLLRPAATAYVAGCAALACDARGTATAGLPLPRAPPPRAFSLLPPAQGAPVRSPGCVSNLGTAFCAANLSAAPAGAWRGGAFLTAAGALLSAPRASRALEWCALDGSGAGRGAQLGAMSTAGDLATWGPSQVAVLAAATGAPRWQAVLSPPSPCTRASPGLASIAALGGGTSLLSFAREAGEVFAYYASGIPDASLVLRANASAGGGAPPQPDFVPSAEGYLLPLARTTDGAARTLYLARFYICVPSPTGNDCSSSSISSSSSSSNSSSGTATLLRGGAAAMGDPTPTLRATPELRLAAVDARHGTPADPRRLEVPWVNLGPPAFAPTLPPALAACTPTDKERLRVSAAVLRDGATLVASFVCLEEEEEEEVVEGEEAVGGGQLLPAAPPPLPPPSLIFLAAFGIAGNATAPRRLWSAEVGSVGWWGGAGALQPPQVLQDPLQEALLWVTGGGGATGQAHLLALNASSGSVLARSTAAELLLRAAGGAAAGGGAAAAAAAAAAACPLAALVQRTPNATLSLTAPALGTLLGEEAPVGALSGGLLLSLTLHASAGAGETAWLVALGLNPTAAAAGQVPAEVLWCSSLPQGGFQGQFVLATQAQAQAQAGSAPLAVDTTVVGVTAAGQVQGYTWSP
jgi:hypothetical protein